MEEIIVNLKENKYKIVIGYKIFSQLGRLVQDLNIGQDAVIITNHLIKNLYGKNIEKSLKENAISTKFLTIPDTEKSKSINHIIKLCEEIGLYDKQKSIFLVALGGGVVGDVTGFVASIYKRGVPYIQIPTTLLAQVDSSIGGKTGVDLKIAKNLVGSFYQPKLVFTDLLFLGTLSIHDIKSGFAEIIKTAIIKDASLFSYLEKNINHILKLDKNILEKIIFRCAQIKAQIVTIDERETKNIRTILNFGHTIGHAIEAATNYTRYTHGEAVAIGMVCASKISERLGYIENKTFREIEDLIAKADLPIKIKNVEVKKIIDSSLRDKKFIKGKNRFVLIEDIGKAFIKENISLEIIKEVLA